MGQTLRQLTAKLVQPPEYRKSCIALVTGALSDMP